jgi:mannosyltransferase
MPGDHEPSVQRKRIKLSYANLSVLSAILLAGALFRVTQLGSTSLWQDEAHTHWLSQLPWNQMIDALLKLGVHPPLHFSLVKVITSLALNGEASLRILSTLADLGAMAIVVWLGYRIAGTAGLLAAGWYWAFHPMTIWYAREGRPYALALLFSTIAVASYFRLREGNSRLAWTAAIVSLALGMMTHYFVLLIAAGLVLLSFFDRPQRLAFRRWTLAFLASLIPLVLWLASYFQQPEISLGIGWIDRPTLSDLAGTIWNLLSGYAGVFYFRWYPSGPYHNFGQSTWIATSSSWCRMSLCLW